MPYGMLLGMIDYHRDYLIEVWTFDQLPRGSSVLVIAGNHTEFIAFRLEHRPTCLTQGVRFSEVRGYFYLRGITNAHYACIGSWHLRKDIHQILEILRLPGNYFTELHPTRSYLP